MAPGPPPERPAEFHIAGWLTAFGDGRLQAVALENLFSNAAEI